MFCNVRKGYTGGLQGKSIDSQISSNLSSPSFVKHKDTSSEVKETLKREKSRLEKETMTFPTKLILVF